MRYACNETHAVEYADTDFVRNNNCSQMHQFTSTKGRFDQQESCFNPSILMFIRREASFWPKRQLRIHIILDDKCTRTKVNSQK
jgi:hypothetical protein